MRIMLAIAGAALTIGCGGAVKTKGDAEVDAEPDHETDTSLDVGEESVTDCGDERSTTHPVVNGTESWDPSVVDLTDGQALAVGALMTRGWGGTWSNSCSATLVTPTLVVTAAHCVRSWWGDSPPSDFRFAVGVDASAPLHQWEPVIAQSHTSYPGGGNARHDVGVLVLGEPATVAVPTIEPIEMNCAALEDTGFLGDVVQNVGYGSTVTGGGGGNTLRWWTVEDVIGLSGFDFTVDGEGYSSVCYGDSGGPSLWTMADGEVRVVGTVSWGDPSCVDEDHFARVDDSCTFLRGFVTECGDVTEEGLCDGDRAVWCEDGVLAEMDCADAGLACGDDGTGRMRCIAECGDLTEEGRCEGETAVWCEDGLRMEQDCSTAGLLCGDDGTGRMRCVEDPCAALGWEGRCEGNDAIWCEDGEIRIRRCGDCDQVCGWIEELGAYYCIDPD